MLGKAIGNHLTAGLRENRRLVADEVVEFEESRLKLQTSGELPSILEIFYGRIFLQGMEAKPEDVNMLPAGFRITRILTDYVCSKTSWALSHGLITPTGSNTIRWHLRL